MENTKDTKQQESPPLPAPAGSATWWVYYLNDEGEREFVTQMPLPLDRAKKWVRAAQNYYGGKRVVQLTETPPNAPAHRPGATTQD